MNGGVSMIVNKALMAAAVLLFAAPVDPEQGVSTGQNHAIDPMPTSGADTARSARGIDKRPYRTLSWRNDDGVRPVAFLKLVDRRLRPGSPPRNSVCCWWFFSLTRAIWAECYRRRDLARSDKRALFRRSRRFAASAMQSADLCLLPLQSEQDCRKLRQPSWSLEAGLGPPRRRD